MEFQGRVSAKGRTLAECLAAAGDLDAEATDHVTLVHDGTEPGGVIGDLSALARFPNLHQLRIFGPVDAASLASLEAVGDRLPYVHCVGPVRITDLTCVSRISGLKRLFLEGLEGLISLAGVEALSSLESLELLGSDLPCGDLTPAGALTNLRHVNLQGFAAIRDVGALGACAGLEELSLVGAGQLDTAPPLSRWPGLKRLEITGSGLLEGLPDLATLKKLKHLALRACAELRVPSGLDKLAKLASLEVIGSPKVALLPVASTWPLLREFASSADHLPPVATLAAAATIDTVIVRGGRVGDSAALGSLVVGARKVVRIEDVEGLDGLRELGGAAEAQRLFIAGSGELHAGVASAFQAATLVDLTGLRLGDEAVAALAALPRLETLHLTKCSGITSAAALGNARALTRLEVQDCADLDYDTLPLADGLHLLGDGRARARAKGGASKP